MNLNSLREYSKTEKKSTLEKLAAKSQENSKLNKLSQKEPKYHPTRDLKFLTKQISAIEKIKKLRNPTIKTQNRLKKSLEVPKRKTLKTLYKTESYECLFRSPKREMRNSTFYSKPRDIKLAINSGKQQFKLFHTDPDLIEKQSVINKMIEEEVFNKFEKIKNSPKKMRNISNLSQKPKSCRNKTRNNQELTPLSPQATIRPHNLLNIPENGEIAANSHYLDKLIAPAEESISHLPKLDDLSALVALNQIPKFDDSIFEMVKEMKKTFNKRKFQKKKNFLENEFSTQNLLSNPKIKLSNLAKSNRLRSYSDRENFVSLLYWFERSRSELDYKFFDKEKNAKKNFENFIEKNKLIVSKEKNNKKLTIPKSNRTPVNYQKKFFSIRKENFKFADLFQEYFVQRRDLDTYSLFHIKTELELDCKEKSKVFWIIYQDLIDLNNCLMSKKFLTQNFLLNFSSQ